MTIQVNVSMMCQRKGFSMNSSVLLNIRKGIIVTLGAACIAASVPSFASADTSSSEVFKAVNVQEDVKADKNTDNLKKDLGIVKGDDLVKEARKYVGKTRYVYGGSSLSHGCDCSGFVLSIYKNKGINYFKYRSSASLYAKRNVIGKSVGHNLYKAKAGDIVIFRGHAGMATGHGTIINCQTSCGARERSIGYMYRYFGGVKAVIRSDKVDA